LILHGVPAAGHALTHAIEGLTSSGLLQGAIETTVATVAGLAAGFAAIPVAKLLEKPMEAFEKLVGKIFKKKPAGAESDNTAPNPSLGPEAPLSKLDVAPSPTPALNAAAVQKPANDEKPPASPLAQAPAAPKP
jgi:hypothetical protein